MWKDEAEVKIRKTMHKPLLFEDATEMCELKLPHAQNSLSQQLTVLKFDPDLNNPHPTCLPDPSPNNSTMQDTNGHVQIQMETSKVSCAEEDTMYTLPMVEVSGPQGSILVFRPWISSEISAASQHLPNPTASDVKKTCIGWNAARLTELKRHTTHAYEQLNRKKIMKQERIQKELHMAAVTMYNKTQQHENHRVNSQLHRQLQTHQPTHKQSKYGRRAHRKNKRRFSNEPCFICCQAGHWRRECPLRHKPSAF
ncbi:hypothetical protein NQD34_013683 [Periophthalmus magnuspinnatus]|nr:hypothetical protein NQD34_013683 [Periophthalmus magnuspinnatus]